MFSKKWNAAVVLLVLLAGCGKATVDGTNKSAASTAPIKEDTTPAELVFYSTSADSPDSFNQRFGDAIRKKFPYYTVKYIQKAAGTTLPEMMASGTPFDIYFDSIGSYMDGMNASVPSDMTDLIKKYNIDFSRFEPSLNDAVKQLFNGKNYGIPVFTNNMIIYYNKELFDKFAVPYPKDGMTWDDALALSKKMDRTDAGKNYYGLSVSPSHIMRLNQYSAPFVDPKTGKAAIGDDKWKSLFQTVFVAPASETYKAKVNDLKGKLPYKDQFVKDRELSMLVYLSNYFYTNPDDLKTMSWDMASMPTVKEMPGVGSQSYPTFFTVTNISKSKDAAMRVIQYLTTDEYQLTASKQGIMTVLKDDNVKKTLGQDTQFKDKNFKSIFVNKFAPIAPKTIYDVDVEKAYSAQLGDLSTGKADLNTVLRTAQDAANKAIDAAKAK